MSQHVRVRIKRNFYRNALNFVLIVVTAVVLVWVKGRVEPEGTIKVGSCWSVECQGSRRCVSIQVADIA